MGTARYLGGSELAGENRVAEFLESAGGCFREIGPEPKNGQKREIYPGGIVIF